jgi:HK97 gp10 family phage protein
MSATLTGFRELEAALSDLPKATGKNVLRRIAKGALQPIANKAQQLAPVDRGDLRVSIVVSEKRTRRAIRFNRFDKNTGLEMAMGPASGKGVLNYATFTEFGTSDTRATPFMRSSWESGKRGALEHIILNLETEISKAAKRVAKKRAKG